MPRIGLFCVRIFVGIILIVCLVKLVGGKDIYQTFVSADKTYIVFACALIPLFVYIKTLKWHRLAVRTGAKENFWKSFRAILIGLGLGMFTPGRVGEVGRIISYSSVNRVTLAGLVVIDRFLDLVTVIYLGMYFLASQISWWTALILFVLNSVLLISLKHIVKVNRLIPSAFRNNWIYGVLVKISECSDALHRKDLEYYVGLSLLNWMVIVFQYHLIVNAYYNSPFNVALGSLPVIQLSNLLPISVGGLGVREGIAVVVMKIYNIPKRVAAVSAFSLFLVDAFIPGSFGVFLFNYKNKEGLKNDRKYKM